MINLTNAILLLGALIALAWMVRAVALDCLDWALGAAPDGLRGKLQALQLLVDDGPRAVLGGLRARLGA